MNDKKLTRSTTDRMWLGVAAGLADYLNIDPVIVRLIFVLTAGHGGLIAYILLALLMPEVGPTEKMS